MHQGARRQASDTFSRQKCPSLLHAAGSPPRSIHPPVRLAGGRWDEQLCSGKEEGRHPREGTGALLSAPLVAPTGKEHLMRSPVRILESLGLYSICPCLTGVSEMLIASDMSSSSCCLTVPRSCCLTAVAESSVIYSACRLLWGTFRVFQLLRPLPVVL